MNRKIGLAILIGSLLIAPGFVAASEHEHSLEQLVVETADSPADHTALAKHYRWKAAEAREEAARHEGMARSYGSQKRGALDQMGEHCRTLARNSRSSAAEFEALAKLHESQAKPAN